MDSRALAKYYFCNQIQHSRTFSRLFVYKHSGASSNDTQMQPEGNRQQNHQQQFHSRSSRHLIQNYRDMTSMSHPVLIPFQCCKHIPSNVYLPDLMPLKFNKLNTEELNIAQHKFNQHSEEKDQMMNRPFINKHISWFTYSTITTVVVAISRYIFLDEDHRTEKTLKKSWN